MSDFNPRSPHGERLPVAAHQRVALLISIHAPRTGSDIGILHRGGRNQYFNPRSPHGERPGYGQDVISIADFNPRSPHGERQRYLFQKLTSQFISIHAPRTGSDAFPILPALFIPISIHAPRTGSDVFGNNSRLRISTFQSTLPARGATYWIIFRR